MWYNFIIKTRKVEGSRGGSLKTEFGILEMDNTFQSMIMKFSKAKLDLELLYRYNLSILQSFNPPSYPQAFLQNWQDLFWLTLRAEN